MVDMYSRIWSSQRAKQGLTLPVVPQVRGHAVIKAAFYCCIVKMSASVVSVLYMIICFDDALASGFE